MINLSLDRQKNYLRLKVEAFARTTDYEAYIYRVDKFYSVEFTRYSPRHKRRMIEKFLSFRRERLKELVGIVENILIKEFGCMD